MSPDLIGYPPPLDYNKTQHSSVKSSRGAGSARAGMVWCVVLGGSGVAASEVDLVVTRDSERANALRAVPCVYELNPVAFIP